MDVSHDNFVVNGKKDFKTQGANILAVLESVKDRPDLKKLLKGFMLESFIKEGNQNAETVENIDLGGLSITDPCLGWEETEALLLKIAAKITVENE